MMKRLVIASMLLSPFLLNAQDNTLLSPDFWKKNPDVAAVKLEISKGNSPSEANRGNHDVTSIAINNNAPLETIKFLIDQEGNSIHKKTHDGRIYLHWATSRGNAELVNYLIQKGSDIHFTDDKGATPLTFAAGGLTNIAVYESFFKAGIDPKQKYQNGANLLLLSIANDKDLKLSEYLSGKGLSIKDKDDQGRTAFDYAARSGNIELLKKLRQKGVTHTGEALLFAAQGGRFSSNNIEVYKYLVEELKIKPSVAGQNGETPLHYVVRRPDQEAIITYLLDKGADINAADKAGNTVLMNAAATRNTALVGTLLPKVKNINAQNKKGETALIAALQSSSPEMVSLLIQNGAKTDVVTKDGNLAYYLVQSYRAPRPNEQADEFSAKMDILARNGVDFLSPQPDGSTLYHIAAAKNDINLFKKLQHLKIDVNAKNAEGMTALHKAALVAKDDIILKHLVSLGAQKDITTEFDETAYNLAQENESLTSNNVNLNFLK